jgi:hypothetical protein
MGSNPTPRAYPGGLYKSHKNKVSKDFSSKTHLIYREQIPSTTHKEEEQEIVKLFQRIDSITKTCSKLYFNKILKRLAEENQENASIICNYITAEETELNIKNSTKESRLKVLVWLSNFLL